MRRTPTSLSLVLALALVPGAPAEETVEQRQAMAHYQKGEERLRDEKWEQAAVEFKKAVDLRPGFVLAHYGLGQANMGLRRYPEAVEAFTSSREAFFKLASLKADDRMRALDVSQRMQDEVRNLTGVDARRSASGGINQRLNVLRDLEQLKRREDGDSEPPAEISLALAGAWFRQGKLEEAERENRNAIRARPDYGQAHSNLAVICLMTGRVPEARAELDKAEKAGFAVNPKLKEELERRAAAQ
jgi:Tfp pilus assembly protein PilF